MTVAELIAELSKQPQDVPVKIEGYYPDTPDGPGAGAAFTPNHIQSLRNEDTGVYAVIWAIGDTE